MRGDGIHEMQEVMFMKGFEDEEDVE